MTRTIRPASIKLGNNYLTPKVIGSNGLNFQDCVAELIANSLDWRITKLDPTVKTKITIILADDFVQIIDNGVGMTYDELNTSLDLAESGDDVRSRLDDENRKGMYGLGMKVAALSLGWKFTINTISISDPDTENIFEFNSRNLTDKKSDYLNHLGISDGPKVDSSPLANFKSGTSILIEDLVKDPINSAVGLGKELEFRFAPDINNLIEQDRLEFVVQTLGGMPYPLQKRDPSYMFEDDVLKVDFEHPGKWAKKREYNYVGSDGKPYQLKGYLQLLKARSVAEQNFGLNLYCKGQLIERYHKDREGLFSMPGRSGEKTYGEIHLDGCTPDNVKANGFVRDAAFWAVRDLISEDLEFYKFLTPTSNQANTRIREEVNKRKGIGSLPESEPEPDETPGSEDESDTENPDNTQPPSDTGGNPEEPPVHAPEGALRITKHLYIQIQESWVHMHGLDKSRTFSWEPFYRKSKLHNDLWELKVYINPDSYVFKSIEENYQYKGEQLKIRSFFKRMAICECVNQVLITHHQYNPEDARQKTDTLVYPFVMQMKFD